MAGDSRMKEGSGKSHYALKKRGSIKKKRQTNNWCRACLSPHCHCDVDTSEHYQLTDEEIQEWYR